jgi:hypothetical protein
LFTTNTTLTSMVLNPHIYDERPVTDHLDHESVPLIFWNLQPSAFSTFKLLTGKKIHEYYSVICFWKWCMMSKLTLWPFSIVCIDI